MNRRIKVGLIKYGCTIAVGALFVCLYLISRDFSDVTTEAERYRILCDAFSLPGAFMMLIGALLKMSELGALDTITYGMRYLIHIVIPSWNLGKKSYLEYVEERRGKRVSGYGFIVIVGAVMFAISLVFLKLFYQVY